MYCSKCGIKNEVKGKFCFNCGYELTADNNNVGEDCIEQEEIDILVKYRSIVNNSKTFTYVGVSALCVALIFYILGLMLINQHNFQNIASFLISSAPVVAMIGGIFVIIAFPIFLVTSPKYNKAKEKTSFDSEKSPEATKRALFNYLRKKGHQGNESRASAAVELISEASGKDAVSVITGILEDHSYDELTRGSAASNLGLEHKTAVDSLIKALQTDQSELVRDKAAMALGFTRNKRAVQPLTEALNNDDSKKVRKSAKEALKWLSNSPQQADSSATDGDRTADPEKLEVPCKVSITRSYSMMGAIISVDVLLNNVEIGKLKNGATINSTTSYALNEITVVYSADNATRTIRFKAESGGSVRIKLDYVAGELQVDNKQTFLSDTGIKAAEEYLARAKQDHVFKMRTQKCINEAEHLQLAKSEGYIFTEDEFKEAKVLSQQND